MVEDQLRLFHSPTIHDLDPGDRKPKASADVKRSLGVDGTTFYPKFGGVGNRRGMTCREPKSAARLTEPQRAILETIVRAGLLRSRGFVEHWLELRGLPGVRDLPAFIGVKAGVHPELRSR
jgi:hypothetical protein